MTPNERERERRVQEGLATLRKLRAKYPPSREMSFEEAFASLVELVNKPKPDLSERRALNEETDRKIALLIERQKRWLQKEQERDNNNDEK